MYANRWNFRVWRKSGPRNTMVTSDFFTGSGNTAIWCMRNEKYAISPLFMVELPKFSRLLWNLGRRARRWRRILDRKWKYGLFRACAMHPAIIIGTVRSLCMTRLWGRYDVPRNAFLVVCMFVQLFVLRSIWLLHLLQLFMFKLRFVNFSLNEHDDYDDSCNMTESIRWRWKPSSAERYWL